MITNFQMSIMKEKNLRLQRVFEVLKNRMIFSYVCLLLFVFASCDQRDPVAEYDVLCDAVYASPQEGVDVAQEYIDHFYKRDGARITEVSEIRDQYREMVSFFENSFSSYADFLNQSNYLNSELSYSNYDGVRKTWSNLYEKELNRFLGPLMDSITESSFESFFKTQVREICENEFFTWNVESIDQVYLSTPELVNTGNAKEASGEYRIHLRGSIIGIRTKDALISIQGTIGPDITGQLNYVRTGYQFLEKPVL